MTCIISSINTPHSPTARVHRVYRNSRGLHYQRNETMRRTERNSSPKVTQPKEAAQRADSTARRRKPSTKYSRSRCLVQSSEYFPLFLFRFPLFSNFTIVKTLSPFRSPFMYIHTNIFISLSLSSFHHIRPQVTIPRKQSNLYIHTVGTENCNKSTLLFTRVYI